jgi:hypothetical protein
MNVKILEVRDRATFLPVMATETEPENCDQQRLLRAAGFGMDTHIILSKLEGGKCTCDPWKWGDRTIHNAHVYIEKNWDTLVDGDVIDVEFILGETKTKKLSQ